MPWKVQPQVVPRHAANKDDSVHPPEEAVAREIAKHMAHTYFPTETKRRRSKGNW